MINNDKFFWVIFDTCTRVQYYQDLHNLLALPEGAIIRYDYRSKWLSDEANRLINGSDPQSFPNRVLLIYGQTKNYIKNSGTPPTSDTNLSNMLWIPTRLAEIELIPPIEGETIIFDLKLLGYPYTDQNYFDKIILSLSNKNEIPFYKWVSISYNLMEYEKLVQGNQTNNWQKIINILGTYPSQFKGDIFWRLKKPRNINESLPVSYHRSATRVNYYFKFFQNQKFDFEIISHTPLGEDMLGVKIAPKVKMIVKADKVVKINGIDEIDLRASGSNQFQIKTNKYDRLDVQDGTMLFNTITKDESSYPVGPNFSFNIAVSKSKSTKVLSFLTFIIVPVAIFVASELFSSNRIISITIYILSLVSLFFSSYLFRGKLPWDWK